MPLAFPHHVVPGMRLEKRGDGRLVILVHQSGPQNGGRSDAIDRSEASCLHHAPRRRAFAGGGIGAQEIEAVALKSLQGRKVLFSPSYRPMHMVALLVRHEHDDVRRSRDDDRLTWRGDAPRCARGCGDKPGSRLQHAAARRRIHRGGSIRAACRRSASADRILARFAAINRHFLIHDPRSSEHAQHRT